MMVAVDRPVRSGKAYDVEDGCQHDAYKDGASCATEADCVHSYGCVGCVSGHFQVVLIVTVKVNLWYKPSSHISVTICLKCNTIWQPVRKLECDIGYNAAFGENSFCFSNHTICDITFYILLKQIATVPY